MQGTITVAEASKIVGKHKSTINRQIEAGKIKAQMDNERKYRVDIESLYSVYPPVENDNQGDKSSDKSGDDSADIILQIEREKLAAIERAEQAETIAEQANTIAGERQNRIEEQRAVILMKQAKIDEQENSISSQTRKINRLESSLNRAVNDARQLAAENARLSARRWWQFGR